MQGSDVNITDENDDDDDVLPAAANEVPFKPTLPSKGIMGKAGAGLGAWGRGTGNNFWYGTYHKGR